MICSIFQNFLKESNVKKSKNADFYKLNRNFINQRRLKYVSEIERTSISFKNFITNVEIVNGVISPQFKKVFC